MRAPALLTLLLAVGLIGGGCHTTAPGTPTPESSSSASAAKASDTEAPLEYEEIITGRLPSSAPLPMVVAIHGLGDAPERFQKIFEFFNVPARIILPRAPVAHGPGFSWFPVGNGVKDVSEETLAGIRRSARRVAELAERLRAEKPTLGKPIITGFSQGGILSFAVALHHGADVDSVLPIAGALPTELWRSGSTHMPVVRAFHGGLDRRIPMSEARALVDRLKDDGADASLQVFKVGHRVSGAMRAAWGQALAERLDAINPPKKRSNFQIP